MAKKGLGKGLDVLIGKAAEEELLEEIPINNIKPNPRQPRRRFDSEGLEEMAESIRAFGVVQPVIVRPTMGGYELVAGERRFRAAKMAGLEKIPAIIKEPSETSSLEIALIENLHRSDLNGIEEATAYQQLLDDFGVTHEELAKRVGKSRAAITNTLRLLQLPPGVQKELMEGRITTGHAKALLSLQEDPPHMERLCRKVIKEGLSVRQTEKLVAASSGPAAAPNEAIRRKKELPPELKEFLDELAEALEARVKCVLGKNRGKLIIEFRDTEDLSRICGNLLRRGEVSRAESLKDGEAPA
ncbi:MAG: ParB/RepB/Spo0J family partition protein [Actinomycetota bacterium]|nr:ParB/RepB/Spo0J family partition protein [Actinomycetota bacterium]